MTRKGELFMEIIKVENIYKSFSQKKVLTDMKSHGVFPLQGPFVSWKVLLFSKLLNIYYNVYNLFF